MIRLEYFSSDIHVCSHIIKYSLLFLKNHIYFCYLANVEIKSRLTFVLAGDLTFHLDTIECSEDFTNDNDITFLDSEAPKINCKNLQTFHLDFGRNESLIRWEEPTATDNVDKLPSIKQQQPLLSQNQSLSEGLHYVHYKATDKAGNSDSTSSCTITLDVRGKPKVGNVVKLKLNC